MTRNIPASQLGLRCRMYCPSAKLEGVGKTSVLSVAAVALKKQPPVQIQAAYWTGALSKADDAQWIFLASL
jgi:hypothetical protein